jgi:hypothetical protein
MKAITKALLASLGAGLLALAALPACNGDGCSTDIPEGSYFETCFSCAMNGTHLICQCDTGHSEYPLTDLDTCACMGGEDIANCRGTLTCGGC